MWARPRLVPTTYHTNHSKSHFTNGNLIIEVNINQLLLKNVFHHIWIIVTNSRMQPSKVFLKPNRVTRHLQLLQITSALFLSSISLFDIASAISQCPFWIARSLAFLHSCNGFINQSNRFSLLFKPFYLFTIYTFF